MDGYGLIILCYALGVILLLAEVVIPSHGLLTVAAIVCLVIAVLKTFSQNPTAGVTAAVICVLFVPTVLIVAIKTLPRLPMGRHVAPPNPEPVRDEDLYPAEELRSLVGKFGRALTPLRPVGTCEFAGRRITCVAEGGLIDQDTLVQGCGLNGKDLIVRPKTPESTTA
jgi:membrane-bound ClpP family serine protease